MLSVFFLVLLPALSAAAQSLAKRVVYLATLSPLASCLTL